ncbi:hypothetical protein PALA51_04531 [Pseudomonas aeruginosa]|nr:hypothetical protein PALA51_04531 [Pseudomonas aeruginosa]
MRKINSEKLMAGDIILSTTPGWQGNLVKGVTRSDISHAMLCVSHSSVMDSTSDGVHARNIDKMFFEESCPLYVYRLRQTISQETLQRVIYYIRARTGTRYSYAEAAVSILRLPTAGTNLQFCSRLVAMAYHSSGIQIVKGSHFFCTPNDLKESEFLKPIEDAVVEVSTEEIAYLKSHGDATDGMRKTTNLLLKSARRAWPFLSSLNDIEKFVLKNPKKDKQIAEAYKTSGYLDYYKVELDNFPWRYDKQEMIKLYLQSSLETKDEIIRYCQRTHQDELNGAFDHWKACLMEAHEIAQNRNLETFRLLADLYFNLCDNHNRRVKIARQMLGIS